ncbi:hypothetical protein RJ639_013845, partial [Escallonia herrerae]
VQMLYEEGDEALSKEAISLAMGPLKKAVRYTGYVINGFKYHTKARESNRATQHSGVMVKANTDSYASARDMNPIAGDGSARGWEGKQGCRTTLNLCIREDKAVILKAWPVLKDTLEDMYNDAFGDCCKIADLGCSTGLNSLSVPEVLEDNNGNIYMARTSPASVFEAYLKQFQMDFSVFLRPRSEEILPRACMVLTFLGRFIADRNSKDCCCVWELLAQSLHDMVSEGYIKEEEIKSFNIAFYTRYKDEVKDVIDEEGSFTLVRLETFEVNWNPRDNDMTDFENPPGKPAPNNLTEHILSHIKLRGGLSIDEPLSKQQLEWARIIPCMPVLAGAVTPPPAPTISSMFPAESAPLEMASESEKAAQGGFLGVLQKAKGKRKEKQPSAELPLLQRRQGEAIKEVEEATRRAEELSKQETDYLAHIETLERRLERAKRSVAEEVKKARDQGIRDFLDGNAGDEWLKKRTDDGLEIYELDFPKAKEMFAKCFPDISLDDFILPAVIFSSGETALPSEAGNAATSHPPGEDSQHSKCEGLVLQKAFPVYRRLELDHLSRR